MGPKERERTLERLRGICLGLPRSSRDSATAPRRSSSAASAGVQQMLVESDPERFFVPPHVGHRGWLGVRLDRGLDWNELAGIAEDAFAEIAPASLVEAAARQPG